MLIAAAGRADARLGATAAHLAEGPGGLDMATAAFVNALVESSVALAVVLDDFHELHDVNGALSWIARLLEMAPGSMQVMICSRRKPALSLGAVRVARDLLELGPESLRFSRAEIKTILRQHDVLVPVNVLHRLEEKTQGLPAAVRLAAILAQERGPHAPEALLDSFNGTHIYVAEYLTEEVVRGLDAELRAFLVAVSVLRELHGSLCRALTGRAESSAMITKLASSSLLLSPVDERGEWFRCHPLLRQFLRRRLEPEKAREMNRRAAGWFRRNADLGSAIEHAIRAGDHPEVCSMMIEIGDQFAQQGQSSQVLRWLETIPLSERRARPRIVLVHAWALMLNGQMMSCSQRLAEVRSAKNSPSLSPTDTGILAGIEAAVAVMTGDPTSAARRARRSLDLLPEEEVGWRGKVTLGLGLSLRLLDRLEDARIVLSEAATLLEQTGNHAANLARTDLADILIDQADLVRADRILRDMTQTDGLPPSPSASPLLAQACASLGKIQYEWDRLDEAEAWASRSLRLASIWQAAAGDMAVAGWALFCRIALARGDLSAAHEALEKLASIAATSSLPASRLELEVHRVRYWIASGEQDRIAEWAARPHANKHLAAPLRHRLILIRVHAGISAAITRTDLQSAIRTLSDLGRAAESSGRQRQLAEVLALRAIALHRANEPTSALEALGTSLKVAHRSRLIRTFADLAGPLEHLLLELRQTRDFRLSSPKLADYLVELLGAVGVHVPRLPIGSTDRVPPVETLTAREREVLRLFERGLTNSETALALGITAGTVKRHASNIFGKLGCHNRGRAVADARRLGIL